MSLEARLEAVLAKALKAEDPAAELARIRSSEPSQEVRNVLETIDPDGFALSAVLVARLRFERLIQGSVRAQRWFDEDPPAFAAAFRRYHGEVPMEGTGFPADEARRFEAWADLST